MTVVTAVVRTVAVALCIT